VIIHDHEDQKADIHVRTFKKSSRLIDAR